MGSNPMASSKHTMIVSDIVGDFVTVKCTSCGYTIFFCGMGELKGYKVGDAFDNDELLGLMDSRTCASYNMKKALL